jgi:plasmid stability protein
MPDILIRNVPPALHAQLKASAARHRRSVTQETIAIIDEKLGAVPAAAPARLPEPIKPRRPITMEETLRYVEEGQR